MLKRNGVLLTIFCLSILLSTCSKSTNSEKRTSPPESTYKSGILTFTNQSGLSEVVIDSYRHYRGTENKFQRLNKWVPNQSSYTLKNLFDGSQQPFKGGDIVSVSFHCQWPGGYYKGHTVEVLIDGSKSIVAVEDCRYIVG